MILKFENYHLSNNHPSEFPVRSGEWEWMIAEANDGKTLNKLADEINFTFSMIPSTFYKFFSDGKRALFQWNVFNFDVQHLVMHEL